MEERDMRLKAAVFWAEFIVGVVPVTLLLLAALALFASHPTDILAMSAAAWAALYTLAGYIPLTQWRCFLILKQGQAPGAQQHGVGLIAAVIANFLFAVFAGNAAVGSAKDSFLGQLNGAILLYPSLLLLISTHWLYLVVRGHNQSLRST